QTEIERQVRTDLPVVLKVRRGVPSEHVEVARRPRLSIRAGYAKEEVSGVIAGLWLRSKGSPGGRIVDGGRGTVEGEVRLGGSVRNGIDFFIAEAPAKLELVRSHDLRQVLFHAAHPGVGP